jgi:hypothetical protein
VSNGFDKPADFLLAEYNTLRTELLQLFSTRYQIITLAFSGFSAVLAVQAFGVANTGGLYLLLLYPILAFFLLNIYVTNARRIGRIEKYLKEDIEACVKYHIDLPIKQAFGWQTYYDDQYGGMSDKLTPPYTLGGRFLFPMTAIITLIPAFQGVKSDLLALKITPLVGFFALALLFLIAAVGLAIWDLRNSSSEYARVTVIKPSLTQTQE